MRSSPWFTLARLSVRHVSVWLAFPLASALRSTGSSADRSASFTCFPATMASSDVPRPCIIGFGSSPSRCGPAPDSCGWSDAGPPKFQRDLFTRDVLLDPGRAAMPRLAALLILHSTFDNDLCPYDAPLRGSIAHPTQPLCTLRVRRRRRLTQHSLPGGLLGLTRAGLAPADRASFAWRLLSNSPRACLQTCVIAPVPCPAWGCRSSGAFLGPRGRAERLGVSPHPRPRVQRG
jgi:hypothetical protein